jgi:hypothetical protein
MNKPDRRKINSRKTRAKKVLTGKKGRGVDAFSPKLGKAESEAALQKRIKMVVEMALAQKIDHSTDVMNDYRHVKRSNLKVIRVG